ncbi:MAG: hypothetical protein AAGH74_16170 [Pseudomonadota bacterium]
MFRTALKAAAFLTLAAATPASAGNVVINGVSLSADQKTWLSNYACGPIYPGNYWLDMQSGEWGYRGVPQAAGHIRERCADQTSRVLSELGNFPQPAKFQVQN